jgi:hypothetical protein
VVKKIAIYIPGYESAYIFGRWWEIIQRAARVNESIGLVLHESTWPFKFVSILETVQFQDLVEIAVVRNVCQINGI